MNSLNLCLPNRNTFVLLSPIVKWFRPNFETPISELKMREVSNDYFK